MKAVDYAQKGWYVFPIKRGSKIPLTTNGLKDATTNLTIIEDWWRKWDDANIGVVTGRASNIVVLDIDPAHDGDRSLRKLENSHGKLPPTLQAITGTKGRHFYFKYPEDLSIVRNKAGLDGHPGIDLRGDGGYVVAPPSIHANGYSYEWKDELSQICNVPRWLLLIMKKDIKVEVTQDQSISKGGRNSQLAAFAGAMRRKGMSQNAIEVALLEENKLRCNPPLDEEEVKGIARSIGRYPSEEKDNRRSIFEEYKEAISNGNSELQKQLVEKLMKIARPR